jgi:hypothetical protein
MKKLVLLLLLPVFLFGSCSKCYDCVETQDILDSNGNVIDQTEVHESVCTADQDEIRKREATGAVCS